MSIPKGLTFKYLKNDLPAGLVVFLVALPLCLGIALASGAPLFSGIISGIIGGTVVAFTSGSPLDQVKSYLDNILISKNIKNEYQKLDNTNLDNKF